MTPRAFLDLLWQYKPEEQYILIWTLQDKRSHWFQDVGKAAEFVVAATVGMDVYVGVGLSKEDHGPTRRCKSEEVSGICGIGTDLDLKSEAHRIQELLDQMADPEAEQSDSHLQRDVSLLLSVPGVGRVIAATMIAEGSDPLAQRDYHALRAYAGIAPVTRQSGKSRQVIMRYGCNHRLRNALYHWARTSAQHDARSRQHYAKLRSAGHNHARALRGVADRLLAVLVAMLKTGRAYDPGLRVATVAEAALKT